MEVIIKQGFVEKMSPAWKDSWQRRWFELTPLCLRYKIATKETVQSHTIDALSEMRLKGEIPLQFIQCVKRAQAQDIGGGASLTGIQVDVGSSKSQIERRFVLKTNTTEDAWAWVGLIGLAVNSLCMNFSQINSVVLNPKKRARFKLFISSDTKWWKSTARKSSARSVSWTDLSGPVVDKNAQAKEVALAAAEALPCWSQQSEYWNQVCTLAIWLVGPGLFI
jgi:hypothetical protein